MCSSRVHPHGLSRSVLHRRRSPPLGLAEKTSFSLSRSLAENRIDRDIDNSQGRCIGVPEIEEFIAVGEVEKRVRIRSRPISVLPVKKSALMLGACCSGISSLAPFCMVFR